MRILYFDAFSGISGDMTLGALIDLGLDFEQLKSRLETLPMADEFELYCQKTTKNGINGTDFNVRVVEHHHHDDDHHHAHHHRGFNEICQIINEGKFEHSMKLRAIHIFKRLGEAEAKVHNTSIEQIHFHEVGAVDSIVDIVGASIALELLGIDKIVCSPLNLGGGTVKCAHGVLPVPAPATAQLIKGRPAYMSDAKYGELTTPTGAAISGEAAEYGPMPQMNITAVGYGFGKRDTGSLNALRVLIGEQAQAEDAASVTLLETNIDDMSAEDVGFAMDILLGSGALDVWTSPIQMKKNRPAFMISVLCKVGDVESIEALLFKHTTTLGIRKTVLARSVLARETVSVDTEYGRISVKLAAGKSKPEYDECAKAALAHGVSISDVKRAVIRNLKI